MGLDGGDGAVIPDIQDGDWSEQGQSGHSSSNVTGGGGGGRTVSVGGIDIGGYGGENPGFDANDGTNGVGGQGGVAYDQLTCWNAAPSTPDCTWGDGKGGPSVNGGGAGGGGYGGGASGQDKNDFSGGAGGGGGGSFAKGSDVTIGTPPDGLLEGHSAATSSIVVSFQRQTIFKRVFVTSNKHKGDMGGIAKADTICNNRASAAGLDGTFKAWLGDGVTGPVDNFAINDYWVYTLVNGEAVGTWSDLVNNTLKNPISVTEFGVMVTGKVWTGVDGGATRFDWDSTCDGWTTKAVHGAHGDSSKTDQSWTYEDPSVYAPIMCFKKLRLYCFEQ
jgi:hypothetical protein